MHLYTCTFYLLINISHLSVYAHSTCAKLKRGCCTSLTLKQVPRLFSFFLFLFSSFSQFILNKNPRFSGFTQAYPLRARLQHLLITPTPSQGCKNVKLINKNTCFFYGSPLNSIASFIFFSLNSEFSLLVTGFPDVDNFWGGGLSFDPRDWYAFYLFIYLFFLFMVQLGELNLTVDFSLVCAVCENKRELEGNEKNCQQLRKFNSRWRLKGLIEQGENVWSVIACIMSYFYI